MMQGRKYKLESCVTSLAQAIKAEALGANRVELCIRLETEGMTPDVDLTSSVCVHLQIPVRVMVRATEVGYEADAQVLQQMIDSITILKKLPIDGFVMGVMKNNRIDREAMKKLLPAAYPLPVTFHKAIDLSEDIKDDIQWLNLFSQVDTILTSGGASRAVEGIDQIHYLKSIFKGKVMAAGKITPDVLPMLHDALQLKWYHGKSIV